LYFVAHLAARSVIHTLSLHDALPISKPASHRKVRWAPASESETIACSSRIMRPTASSSELSRVAVKTVSSPSDKARSSMKSIGRSEEHTSELQSRENLVCRLLLEKKK